MANSVVLVVAFDSFFFCEKIAAFDMLFSVFFCVSFIYLLIKYACVG